jgi:hypothetical protein
MLELMKDSRTVVGSSEGLAIVVAGCDGFDGSGGGDVDKQMD